MIFFRGLWVVVLFIAAPIFAADGAGTCDLDSSAVHYEALGRRDHFYEIRVSAETMSLSPHQNFKFWTAFQNEVKAKVADVEARALLRRQREFYTSFPKEQKRFDRVLEEGIGDITPLSCLEAFLMDVQIREFSPASEFQAVILSHPRRAEIKVLVHTQGLSDRVQNSSQFDRRLSRQMRGGWKLAMHVHNHPFAFDNPYGDIAGTVIPSGADIQLYKVQSRSRGLRWGRVINGFDGLSLKASDFNRL